MIDFSLNRIPNIIHRFGYIEEIKILLVLSTNQNLGAM